MAIDSTKIRLAPSGHVYIGAFGVSLPTDVTTPLAEPTWHELGYLDTNGVSVTPSFDTNAIGAWQTPVDVLTSINKIGLSVKINMLQVTSSITAEYFFGSVWTNPGAGIAKMTISSNPVLAVRSMVVEWTDDNLQVSRLILPRGFITDRDAMVLSRTEATAFGVTFAVQDNNGTLATLLTNNTTLVSGS
jgi:hypothetical protein